MFTQEPVERCVQEGVGAAFVQHDVVRLRSHRRMDVQQLSRHARKIDLLPQVEDGHTGCLGAPGEFGDAGQAGLSIVGLCHQGALHVDDEQRGIRHIRQPIPRAGFGKPPSTSPRTSGEAAQIRMC